MARGKQAQKSITSAPRISASFNGIFIPVESAEITVCAYGIADAFTLTTFTQDNQDWGGIAQQYKKGRVPISLKVGLDLSTQKFEHSTFYDLMLGYFDEVEEVWESNETTLKGLGLFTVLSDKRETTKAYLNVDAGQAIKQLITNAGLKCSVDKAGITVGRLLTQDQLGMGRAVRVSELVSFLSQGLNWTTRVQGDTIIVGFPPNRLAVPTMNLTWGQDLGTKLLFTHNPYGSKNIKVKVISYIPRKKTRINAESSVNNPFIQSLLAGATMNLPAASKPKKAKQLYSGTQKGTTSGPQEESASQTFVYHIPGINAEQANLMASRLAAEIASHEFVVEFEFAPTPEQIPILAKAGPEILFAIDGTKPSQRGLYRPRHIKWTYNVSEGSLLVSVLAVNHEIPQDTGGL